MLAGTAALAWACGSSAPAVFYGAVSPPEPDGGDGDAFFPIYGGADVMPPDVSQPDASTDAATDARDGSIDGSDADSD